MNFYQPHEAIIDDLIFFVLTFRHYTHRFPSHGFIFFYRIPFSGSHRQEKVRLTAPDFRSLVRATTYTGGSPYNKLELTVLLIFVFFLPRMPRGFVRLCRMAAKRVWTVKSNHPSIKRGHGMFFDESFSLVSKTVHKYTTRNKANFVYCVNN